MSSHDAQMSSYNVHRYHALCKSGNDFEAGCTPQPYPIENRFSLSVKHDSPINSSIYLHIPVSGDIASLTVCSSTPASNTNIPFMCYTGWRESVSELIVQIGQIYVENPQFDACTPRLTFWLSTDSPICSGVHLRGRSVAKIATEKYKHRSTDRQTD